MSLVPYRFIRDVFVCFMCTKDSAHDWIIHVCMFVCRYVCVCTYVCCVEGINRTQRQQHTRCGPEIFDEKTQFNQRRMMRCERTVTRRVFCMRMKYFIPNWNEGVESLVAVVDVVFFCYFFVFSFWSFSQLKLFEVSSDDYLFIWFLLFFTTIVSVNWNVNMNIQFTRMKDT